MNRKLRHTLIALTTSGLLLVVGLLTGDPRQIHSPLAAQAREAAQSHRAVQANDADGSTRDHAQPSTRRGSALKRTASSHRKFAMPYFSFAQGARSRGG